MSHKRKELAYDNFCPDCLGATIIYDEDSGEIVCARCGLVVSDSILNMGPEWRAYTINEIKDRSRVGLPLSYSIHDKGLSTIIGPINKDAHGVRIQPETKANLIRLRKWHTRLRTQESANRNLSQAMAELEKLSEKLHIPPTIKEEAAYCYRKALKKELVRGRSISAIIAASLYVACRLTQTPRTLKEIADHSYIDTKELARCYRLLIKNLKLRMPIPEPQNRIHKIAAQLDIEEKVQQTAVEILREAKRLKETVGKDPMGLAAAALYIACVINHRKQTQKTIADAAGVTEVTIRNRYKSLKKTLNLEI